jgi:putative alpha-1,2-mannosidase
MLIAVSVWFMTGCFNNPQDSNQRQSVNYVDPLIVSVAKTKFYGRTFPGASRPFSLVKLGTDTYTGGDVG